MFLAQKRQFNVGQVLPMFIFLTFQGHVKISIVRRSSAYANLPSIISRLLIGLEGRGGVRTIEGNMAQDAGSSQWIRRQPAAEDIEETQGAQDGCNRKALLCVRGRVIPRGNRVENFRSSKSQLYVPHGVRAPITSNVYKSVCARQRQMSDQRC